MIAPTSTPNHPPRRLHAVALAATAALVGLAGCGQVPPTAGSPGSSVTPMASVTETATPPSPATPSASPSDPASTNTPTASPSSQVTDGPAVKASGSLRLFAEASKKLAGTCRTTAGAPTIAVSDRKNDFFQTIDVVLVLNQAKKAVSKLTIQLGEDSELITRTLTYDAAKPAANSSAVVTSQGSIYRVTGKLASQEDGKDAGTMPFTLTVVCAGSW